MGRAVVRSPFDGMRRNTVLPRPLTATIAAALACVGAMPLVAQEADEVSRVALVAEEDTVRVGQTVLLGLHFELDEGWHIYWDGFNDTGFAPVVEWSLPDGVSVGQMLWPAPKRYTSPGNILDHVYEGRPTILVPVTIAASVAAGTKLEIRGEVEWLVCDDICLPGFGPISIDLRTSAGRNEESKKLNRSSHIGRAASRLPEPLLTMEQIEGLSMRWSEGVINVRVDDADSLTFFPSRDSVSLISVLGDASSEGESMALRVADADEFSGPQG